MLLRSMWYLFNSSLHLECLWGAFMGQQGTSDFVNRLKDIYQHLTWLISAQHIGDSMK